MAKKEYALYKGETLLDIGTIQEIADRRGKAYGTIRFYMSPTYKKRIGKNPHAAGRFELVPIDDDPDDN